MARTDPQLNFRIPADLKARLETAAEKNQRTLTGELVARLEASFKTFVDVGVNQESEPETLTIKEPSRWPWPNETLARVEEKLGTLEHALDKVNRLLVEVEGIESGEVGTPSVKMSPAPGAPVRLPGGKVIAGGAAMNRTTKPAGGMDAVIKNQQASQLAAHTPSKPRK